MTDTDTLSTISIWRLIFPKRVNVNVILPKILDLHAPGAIINIGYCKYNPICNSSSIIILIFRIVWQEYNDNSLIDDSF